MSVLKNKIKGGTIIESLVAITIIAMVFTSALIFFVNTRRDINQPLKTIASALINNELNALHRDKHFANETYAKGNILIEKQMINTDSLGCLNILSVKALRRDNHKIIFERRLLVLKDQIKTGTSNE